MEEKIDKEFLKQLTILYVEDEDDVKEQFSRFLKRRIKTLYTASNGREGLKLFKRYNPDIIVTDIQMPKMSGLAMAETIREVNSEIPIIVITAFNESDYLLKSIDLGIDKYLFKPIIPTILIEVIYQKAKKYLENS